MDTTLDDIEFLASSQHRVGVLDALIENPCTRRDLRTETGASSPTMGRVLTDLEDRHWITKAERTYQLTDLGEFVATQLREFRDAMHLEHSVREVWPWLPTELDGFSVELLTDAVVSYPGPGYPYETLHRHVQLVEETETIRGFGMVLLKANVREVYFDCLFDGMAVEMIYPPHVFETMLAWNSDIVTAAIDRDNYTVMLHDDLPNGEWCGICLSDDRVSLCCYDPDTGMLQSLIDTDDPNAYSWGESIVEQYRAEAQPLDDVDDLLP